MPRNAPRHRPASGGASAQRRMRYSVRAAINEWDIKRLYPDSRPQIEYGGDPFRPEERTEPGPEEADPGGHGAWDSSKHFID